MTLEDGYMNGDGRSSSPNSALGLEPHSLSQSGGSFHSTMAKQNNNERAEDGSLAKVAGSSHSASSGGTRRRGLRGGGPRASANSQTSGGVGRGLRSNIPRPAQSTDGSPPRRTESNDPAPLLQQPSERQQPSDMIDADVLPPPPGSQAMTMTSLPNTLASESTTVPPPQDGLMRGRARATAPDTAATMEPFQSSAKSSGVGGAPQGKMRRSTAASPSPTRPGAESVVGPTGQGLYNPGGVGGAPQGKMRRSTASVSPSRPGAVSVVEPVATSLATEQSGGTGVGGAPQGKIRRAASPTNPGALSVSESSAHNASSGVGGAPQGKMRRSTASPTRPGVVSSVEPVSTYSAVEVGVGGAPQGKMRRAASPTKPGAVSIAESATPAATTGVGGAPQGKMRRSTAVSPTRPGAVSVVEPVASSLAAEAGSDSGVGGAPQGKIRRSVSPTKPGAVSMVESSAHNASSGVGGAPQGKMKRSTTSPTRPGAVSVVEPVATSLPSEAAGSTGIGGAPQGKVRRTTSPARPGAVNVVESVAEEAGISTGVGGAPQGKMRRSTSPKPGAVGVVAPDASGAVEIDRKPPIRRTLSGESTHSRDLLPNDMQGVPRRSRSGDSTASRRSVASGQVRGLRRTASRDSTDSNLRASSNHRRGLRRNMSIDSNDVGSSNHKRGLRRNMSIDSNGGRALDTNEASMQSSGVGGSTVVEIEQGVLRGDVQGTTAPSNDSADPQTIRRKQIQEVMRDSSISQQAKQARIQELMAGGMPKPDSTHSQLAGASNDTEDAEGGSSEDPQAIRRKQMQKIMMDNSLSQQEKQLKMQQLMASGMPKSKRSGTETLDVRAESTPHQQLLPPTTQSTALPSSSSDAESIRRQQIQKIMMDPTLTPREKQVKTQELMAGGMPKVPSSGVSSPPVPPPTTPQPSAVAKDPEILRRRQIQQIMMDRSLTQREKQAEIQKLMAGGMPKVEQGGGNGSVDDEGEKRSPDASLSTTGVHHTLGTEGPTQRFACPQRTRSRENSIQPVEGARPVPGVDLGEDLEPESMPKATGHSLHLGAASGHSALTEDTFFKSGHDSLNSMHDDSSSGVQNGAADTNVTGRISRRDRLAARETLAAARAAGVPMDASEAVASAKVAERPQSAPTASGGFGGAPQGKMRRATSSAQPGAVSVVEPSAGSHEIGASTGVGGAPKGKMRRTAPAAGPGAMRVVEPSSTSSRPAATTVVGGAPQGKARRTTSPARPGAMSVTEPAVSSHPTAGTGVGGAPQGKMRRSTNTMARPGAMSVDSSAYSAEPRAAPTGVGGAPQGKIRRATTSEVAKPGAVSINESAPTEPGATVGIGGAPQGKFRRATTSVAASSPGAVSVVEPATASAQLGAVNAPTGVGGAPQGKFRRATTSEAARPGAVNVIETTTSRPEPGSTTGVGGAPQGKIRRAATSQATIPGAMNVIERTSTRGEPGAPPTGVGGAPQGKFRRATTSEVAKPGALSVTETTTSVSEPGAPTGVGGAPQGKIRRTTTSQATMPGAMNVIESTSTRGEPGAPQTGVGGAPQGKFRRATTTEVARPGALSISETTTSVSEPGAATGVGRAPQGKIRRTTTSQATMPGAMNVIESTSTRGEPGAPPTGVGGAPQGKFRRATTSEVARPGALRVAETTSSVSEPGATTGVGGAPQGKIRRTATSQATMPGAMNVIESTSTRGEPAPQTGVGGAPQGKFRRATTTEVARPGALSVTETTTSVSEPGATAGVGGAPQGKFRRSTAIPAAPGASNVVEPSTVASELRTSTTGVGGAPQGKMRRSTRTSVSAPGAVSMVDNSMPAPEPGAGTGVGGAPQGKFRRSTVTPSTQPGASSVVEVSPTGAATGVGGAPQGKMRRATSPVPPATRGESGASTEHSFAQERHVIGVSNEPRVFLPSVTVHSMQASEQGVDDGMSMEHKSYPDASNLRSSTHHTSGSSGARGLSNKSVRSSTHGVSPPSLHGSVSGMSHGTASSDAISRGFMSRQSQAPSQSSFANESAQPEPVEDSDFNTAIQMVEDDLQVKMRMRAEAQSGTVAGYRPGADTGNDSIPEHDPRGAVIEEEQPVSDSEDEDDHWMEKEKEMVKIGAQTGSLEPTGTQNRMEQKILQMEQEQQARDDKLEEIEEMNARSRGPERYKDPSSPHAPIPEVFHDESEPIENGFLNPDPEAIRQAEEDGLAIAIAVDEEEEPDVYDVELKMYDPEAKPPFYKNRRFRCYSALILLLTIGAIVTAAIVSAQKGNEIILITQAPSSAPSQAPTTTRETAVRGELARVIGDIVNEPDTPHEQALNWILHVDPMQLDEFSENLIQRYTLALFYYQTSLGYSWRSCNPPVEGEDFSCTYLDMNRNEDLSINYIARNDTPSVRWLSEKHECEWAEVLCHPVTDGNVIGIDIMGQNLTGTLPEELRYLDDLMWLTLSYNEFTGTIPEVYGEFPYMTIFEVTENHLTGSIPGGFFSQPNLLQLNPAYNLFTGTIPPEIGDLTTLHSLFFFNTMISGSLPTEMGRLEDVRNLWLWDNNELTGPIPSEIGELSLLEDLRMTNNGHSGPIPSEMGLLTNLEQLLLAGSNMAGSTIPEEFWNMSAQFVDFNDAGIGGTISTNIGRMTTLKGLKASRNFFNGTLPSQIGLLDDLLLLWIHVNPDLTGEVPLEVCKLRGPENLMFLNADCAGSAPRIGCNFGCCTGCCDEYGQCQVQ